MSVTCEGFRNTCTPGTAKPTTRAERGAMASHMLGCPDCQKWLDGVILELLSADPVRVIGSMLVAGQRVREDLADPEFMIR